MKKYVVIRELYFDNELFNSIVVKFNDKYKALNFFYAQVASCAGKPDFYRLIVCRRKKQIVNFGEISKKIILNVVLDEYRNFKK